MPLAGEVHQAATVSRNVCLCWAYTYSASGMRQGGDGFARRTGQVLGRSTKRWHSGSKRTVPVPDQPWAAMRSTSPRRRGTLPSRSGRSRITTVGAFARDRSKRLSSSSSRSSSATPTKAVSLCPGCPRGMKRPQHAATATLGNESFSCSVWSNRERLPQPHPPRAVSLEAWARTWKSLASVDVWSA